jgi:hypothetical protein
MFVFRRSFTAVAAGLGLALLVVGFDRACNPLDSPVKPAQVDVDDSDLERCADAPGARRASGECHMLQFYVSSAGIPAVPACVPPVSWVIVCRGS